MLEVYQVSIIFYLEFDLIIVSTKCIFCACAVYFPLDSQYTLHSIHIEATSVVHPGIVEAKCNSFPLFYLCTFKCAL